MRWIQGVELTVFSLCGKSYNYILFVNSRTYKKEQFEWRFESIHNNFNQNRKKKNSNNEKERTKINNNNNSLHTDKIHKRYTSAASECITTHNRAEQQKNIEHNNVFFNPETILNRFIFHLLLLKFFLLL